MKRTLIACLAGGLCLPATPALTQDENEGRRLAELAFNGLDTEGRGFINMSQYLRFGAEVFTSMDSDQDELLTLAEFVNWDFGMKNVAEERGLVPSYETALRVVYAFWDRNGDDQITSAEHGQSLALDFQRADTDQDTLLTEAEFLGGFSVMVALRAALAPDVGQ